MSERKDDPTYAEALKQAAREGSRQMGEMFADMFRGMIAEGMNRSEALQVVMAWASGLGSKPS